MSRGSCPWEAESVVFYESRRLWEPEILRELMYRVGPLKETWSSKVGDPGVRGLESLEARSDERLEGCVPEEIDVLYSSIRCLGAPGGARSRRVVGLGFSA